jgi:hypothetical protein
MLPFGQVGAHADWGVETDDLTAGWAGVDCGGWGGGVPDEESAHTSPTPAANCISVANAAGIYLPACALEVRSEPDAVDGDGLSRRVRQLAEEAAQMMHRYTWLMCLVCAVDQMAMSVQVYGCSLCLMSHSQTPCSDAAADGGGGLEEYERGSDAERALLKFTRRIARCPQQVCFCYLIVSLPQPAVCSLSLRNFTCATGATL